MQDTYDHNQTLVPESFLALHSRHGRALRPRAEIEARHEACEDLALHTAAFLAARHQEGDDPGDALKRVHAGLQDGPAALPAAEVTWVVRRVAELQEWPEPGWLGDLAAGDTTAPDAAADAAAADRRRGRSVSLPAATATATASAPAGDSSSDATRPRGTDRDLSPANPRAGRA